MYARLAALALLLLARPVAAQFVPPGPASAEHDGGWLALGVGIASAPHYFSLAATGSVGRTRVVQVGLHSTGSLGPSLNAIHLGGGLSHVDRWVRVALAVGPAYVWRVRHEAGERDVHPSLGGVVSAQGILTPFPQFGFGLDAFAIVSPDERGLGLALTVVVEGNK